MTTDCETPLMEGTQLTRPEADAGESFQVNGLRVVPSAGKISGPGGDEQVDPKVLEVLVALALARTAAERAVALDPTLAGARARLGRVLEVIGEREAAAAHMAKALEFGHNSPTLALGSTLAGRTRSEAVAAGPTVRRTP